MRRLIAAMVILCGFAIPVAALEWEVPEAPSHIQRFLPDPETDFGAGIWMILKKALGAIRPDLREGTAVCLGVAGCMVLLSLMQFLPGQEKAVSVSGSIVISLLLLNATRSLVRLGSQTVIEISEYAKLFFPVITAAMAAQGGITSSAALYAGTMVCCTALSSLISGVLIPLVSMYLALGIAGSVAEQPLVGRILGTCKSVIIQSLKIILYGFTGYMALTGAVTGTTDATALKVTKAAISTAVPVVGGMLSNASEAIVLGAATAKNAAGIYGILAFIALGAGPFLRIGGHYLILKLTADLGTVFGCKNAAAVVSHFKDAMALVLAMTGTVCVMLIISITCFMKGVA